MKKIDKHTMDLVKDVLTRRSLCAICLNNENCINDDSEKCDDCGGGDDKFQLDKTLLDSWVNWHNELYFDNYQEERAREQKGE